MKKLKLLTAMLLFCNIVFSQESGGSIGISAQYGRTPYESADALGGALKFDFSLNRRLSLSANAGHIRGKTSIAGRSQGQSGSVVWDNSYQFTQKENFSHLDVDLLLNLFPNNVMNKLKIGAGLSLTYTVLEYPTDIFINRGIIETLEFGKQSKAVPMLNLLIEDEIKISDRLIFFGRATFRTSFTEKHILAREIRYENGVSSATSGIISNFTLALGLGYRL
mgnify:CR=1 FL=1|jgi:hypothetical protein